MARPIRVQFSDAVEEDEAEVAQLRLEDARRLVAEFVDHCNTVRLHSELAGVRGQPGAEPSVT